MEVHLTPEKEAQLQQFALQTGRDTSQVIEEAVNRLLEDARFRAAVQRGFASLERGNFIEEEEMEARVEQMLGS